MISSIIFVLLSVSRPDEAPLILNYIGLKDCNLDDYITIISSLSSSPFCSNLSDVYKNFETLPERVMDYEMEESEKEVKEEEYEMETAQNYEHNIFKAIENNELQSIYYMIEKEHASIDIKAKNNMTPLLFASSHGRLPIVKYLIEQCNANINDTDVYGNNCLHLAVTSGNVELVSYLIKQQGVDVESRNNIQWTPLIVAANCGDLKIVKYLIEECNADYDATDGEYTALHTAVLGGYTDLVKYLNVFARKISYDIIDLTDDKEIKQILKNRKKLLKSRQ